MIMNRVRSLAAAGALILTAILATQTSAGPATAAADTVRVPEAAAAAAFCPTVGDPLYAAADRSVDVHRIVPDPPTYRGTCDELYRADGRAPSVVFHDGFHPKAPLDGQYDLAAYVEVNQPSPFVSTSYDHDLYKQWKSAYNYYVDAPGGIDVNATIGDTHKWAAQHEVAFAGGIARRFIVGACPVDKATRSEVLSACVRNPFYVPWRGTPAPEPERPELLPVN
ncbi:hypothetical protein SAMN05216223_108286 [Actinacidiphila yanglinensis]|uniref:Pierisin-like domain-containing protein n=1 Tax=Actinacidiphila yanglinensis TaxID=310779 RepID=A0A1H6CD05_9ACTN|nr:ADP-ribosyltransferase [Actinacidiphila yanglinensis]SEG70657.1 hypothetical protein SAMN05216223_108286 [Actinacidiphila yanglinensis]